MDVTDCVGLSADGAVFQLGQRYLRINLVHYTGTLLHCTALRCAALRKDLLSLGRSLHQ